MKKAPNIWELAGLCLYVDKGECQAGLPDGRYVPARPLGFYGLRSRLKAAWMVFIGKADAVIWPGGQ